jgi:Sodium Bile acid symporter family
MGHAGGLNAVLAYRADLILVSLARCVAEVLIWTDLASGAREMGAPLAALNATAFQVVAYAHWSRSTSTCRGRHPLSRLTGLLPLRSRDLLRAEGESRRRGPGPANSVVEFAASPAATSARVLSTLLAKRPSPAGP